MLVISPPSSMKCSMSRDYTPGILMSRVLSRDYDRDRYPADAGPCRQAARGARGDDLPDLDLDVEGIVERIQGLEKRLRAGDGGDARRPRPLLRRVEAPLHLRRAPDRTSTPGDLSAKLELSSGAMTNRHRPARGGWASSSRHRDPDDRRGVRVELTDAGADAWIESTNTQAIKEKLIAGALSKTRAAPAERAPAQADARVRRRRV